MAKIKKTFDSEMFIYWSKVTQVATCLWLSIDTDNITFFTCWCMVSRQLPPSVKVAKCSQIRLEILRNPVLSYGYISSEICIPNTYFDFHDSSFVPSDRVLVHLVTWNINRVQIFLAKHISSYKNVAELFQIISEYVSKNSLQR